MKSTNNPSTVMDVSQSLPKIIDKSNVSSSLAVRRNEKRKRTTSPYFARIESNKNRKKPVKTQSRLPSPSKQKDDTAATMTTMTTTTTTTTTDTTTLINSTSSGFEITTSSNFSNTTQVEQSRKTIVPDHLGPNLDVLFIGINPGLQSAAKGHHYAHSNNHFWKCMTQSGLVPPSFTYLDDSRMPTYNFGLTNIVARKSSSSSDLTNEEIKGGIPEVQRKIKECQPLFVRFVGKGIYEQYSGEKNCTIGLQPASSSFLLDEKSLGNRPQPRYFVVPSSSSRVTSYNFADKLNMFKELKELVAATKKTILEKPL